MAGKVTGFNEQMQEERAYYLGLSDKVPGTNKSIAELQKEYRKSVEAEDARMAQRRQAKVVDQAPPRIVTTAVTHGVVVEVSEGVPKAPEVKKRIAPTPAPLTPTVTPSGSPA